MGTATIAGAATLRYLRTFCHSSSNPRIVLPFVSPTTGLPLQERESSLESTDGESFPIVNGIPRFVSADNYAAAFGLEWTIHRTTQLDSFSGQPISRTRLERCLGRPLSSLKGLRVLEAGCGAGRFTELLVGAGALVHSMDLSVAVDANRENIGHRPNYRIAQADLRQPPFPRASFDVVISLGVLQHTPSPEESLTALWSMVRPGGMLVVDHYRWSLSSATKVGPWPVRAVLKRMSPARAKTVSDRLVALLFPLHWTVRRVAPLQFALSRISPLLVFMRSLPELDREQHYQWARLDTYDALTDTYKHLRTRAQIERAILRLGAVDVHTSKAGNGIEARGRKPV